MSALLRTPETPRERPWWLADDAVWIGPVSAPNSLLTGKLTGNFTDSGPLRQFRRLFAQQLQKVAAKFPKQWNREIFLRNRELFAKNREISSASREQRIRGIVSVRAYRPGPVNRPTAS